MTSKTPLRHRSQQGSLSTKVARLVRLFEDDAAVRYAERTATEYAANVRAFLMWAEARGFTVSGLRK